MQQSSETAPVRRAVVVTGATGSIGTALVEALYASGRYVVIGACRNTDRLRPLAGHLRQVYPGAASRLIAVSLDLSTVKAAAEGASRIKAIIESEGLELCALLNNAGTMPVDRLEVSPGGLEMSLQVNCISTLALTLSLLPVMSSGGVVVMTTSVTRFLPVLRSDFAEKALKATNVMQRFNNYGRSKMLLTLAAGYLSAALAPRGIRVNCADPGVVDSGIITLGYPVVDRIADVVARPLMSTPARGASAALAAMSTPQTGIVARPRGMSRIRPLTAGEHRVVADLLRMATP